MTETWILPESQGLWKMSALRKPSGFRSQHAAAAKQRTGDVCVQPRAGPRGDKGKFLQSEATDLLPVHVETLKGDIPMAASQLFP